MADVWQSIISIFNFKASLNALLWTLIAVAILFLVVFVILKIRERKKYIVLAEIVPKWSISEQKTEDYTIIEKKTLFGTKKIKVPIEPEQRMITTFVPAKYEFNDDGTINLILKTKPKSIVPNITYDFFVPLNYKHYKLYIKLVRYGAVDYKPCKVKISGLNEIRKLYDSEATYITTLTINELLRKYYSRDRWEKYAPYVALIISAFVFLITIYFISQHFSQSMKVYVDALAGFTNQLENLTKTLLVSVK